MPPAPSAITPSDLSVLAACVKEHTLKKATNEKYFRTDIAPTDMLLDIPYPNQLRIMYAFSTRKPRGLSFNIVVMGGSNLADGLSVFLTNTENCTTPAKVQALVRGISDLAKHPQKSLSETAVA